MPGKAERREGAAPFREEAYFRRTRPCLRDRAVRRKHPIFLIVDHTASRADDDRAFGAEVACGDDFGEEKVVFGRPTGVEGDADPGDGLRGQVYPPDAIGGRVGDDDVSVLVEPDTVGKRDVGRGEADGAGGRIEVAVRGYRGKIGAGRADRAAD